MNSFFPEAQEDKALFIKLYEYMLTAREIDNLEEQYTARGEAFFHVSGAGHEAVAMLNPYLIQEDYLHCHYRDKSLMLARGISPEMFFYSLFCKDNSHSRGRQMSAHMSSRENNILSIVGPVGNNALQAVGIAAEIKNQSVNPLVLCSLGDGTTQQGEVLEAIAEAVRWQLPVLFLIEDNHYSISTITDKKTFYHRPDGIAYNFYGLSIHHLDGKDPFQCYQIFGKLVSNIRQKREPIIAVMKVERLSSHTNADDQSIYRNHIELEKIIQKYDPLKIFRINLENSKIQPSEIDKINEKVKNTVKQAAKKAQFSQEPEPCLIAKNPFSFLEKTFEYTGKFGSLTMLEAMRQVFQTQMERDERVFLYGEDIEDPKGDVFGITKGLSSRFPGRVLNSPLSESTIIGTSIGRALAGGKPVAFLQFADFLPLAFNQIASELGSIYWRTDGAWQCPVIIMVTCGGYRPGLGPFHAQSLESILVHTPGINVAMPSTAGDAAGMLNAAFDSGIPTVFFYPKSCLNLTDSEFTTSNDTESHCVPSGKARIVRNGTDITFVCYGNTVQLCLKVANSLDTEGIASEIIDLRWLSPWDEKTILKSVQKTGKLIVVHEDNLSCGLGAEILAVVAEKSTIPVQMRRVTRPDTYVPCNFGNQLEILPSYKRILETATELLNLELLWITPPPKEEGIFFVEAIGGGPSDEMVIVVELAVEEGERVKEGQTIAVLETSKATFDLEAPVKGVVTKIYCCFNQEVQVGKPLFKIEIDPKDIPAPKPITREEPGQPIITRKIKGAPLSQPSVNQPLSDRLKVGIQGVAFALPSRNISNEEIVVKVADKDPHNIFKLTGIKNRHWIGENENALTLAIKASHKVLRSHCLNIEDINLIIFSSGTPSEITPSLACQLLYSLAKNEHECQAYDINAACSGYLYGLQNAYLYLQNHPNSRVLLITSETLSPLLNPKVFETYPIFADAATATILCGENYLNFCEFLLNEPLVTSLGEPIDSLFVPTLNSGKSISMRGRRVFLEGVKRMTSMLYKMCSHHNLTIADLDLVIPHQANQRIIDAISKKLGLVDKVASNIQKYGNTSSSSIPLYLAENWHGVTTKTNIGLTAFGGGFTYGAVLLERYLKS